MRLKITDPINTKEASELLGVKVRRVRLLCESGKLEAVKFGRDWLISRASVEALRQAQNVKYRRKREGKE